MTPTVDFIHIDGVVVDWNSGSGGFTISSCTAVAENKYEND